MDIYNTCLDGWTTTATMATPVYDNVDARRRWLVLLRHGAKCRDDEAACPFGRSCTSVKRLWQHMLACTDDACAVPHCVLCKDVLDHHALCRDLACDLCALVRPDTPDLRAARLIAEVEAEREADARRREARRARKQRVRDKTRKRRQQTKEAENEEEEECVVCMDAAPDVRLVPCGHRVMCDRCADVLVRRRTDAECPVCRRKVESTTSG